MRGEMCGFKGVLAITEVSLASDGGFGRIDRDQLLLVCLQGEGSRAVRTWEQDIGRHAQ